MLTLILSAPYIKHAQHTTCDATITIGSGTFPSHRFLFTQVDDPNTVLATFVVQDYPENVYWYDPFYVEGDVETTERNLAVLNPAERELYEVWRKTLSFHEQYRNFTGRSYLANYLRPPPQHFMWRGDYLGQQHFVETMETHFLTEPPPNLLHPIAARGKMRRLSPDSPRILQDYRAPGRLNLTLTVLSVAPRVFQIDNFLSPVEVDHITELASGIKLSLSATGEAEAGEPPLAADPSSATQTRTSYNTWVARDKSPIIDAIYRRAADLLRIDEALLRQRDVGEIPQRDDYLTTLGEDLQLVNYKERQGPSVFTVCDIGMDNYVYRLKLCLFCLFVTLAPAGQNTRVITILVTLALTETRRVRGLRHCCCI